jgi:hypothetical protein
MVINFTPNEFDETVAKIDWSDNQFSIAVLS